MTTSTIMNPPYSLKYSADAKYRTDKRFAAFGLAPKSKADYMFLLDGLSRLSEDGAMAVLLPHGVLFRGGAEKTIRKALLQQNLIDAIIGLPSKLFEATDTPTVAMVLRKNRKTDDVLVVDASKHFDKDGPKNRLTAEHLDKLRETYKNRQRVEKYAEVVYLEEIEDNDYNLNIPRYVDTIEREPPVDIVSVSRELREIEQEIRVTQAELYKMLLDLVATDGSPKKKRELRALQEIFKPVPFDERVIKTVEHVAKTQPERYDKETGLPTEEYQQMTLEMMAELDKTVEKEAQLIDGLKKGKRYALDNMFV